MQNILIMSKLAIILLITLFNFSAYADGDEEGIFKRWYERQQAGVSQAKFQQYNELCGGCHFPYQPGLLPAMSWEKIMTTLDNHFEQPVVMSAVENRTITRYLLDNSAGHVNDEVSNKILKSFNYNPVPVRITQTPYFVSTHKLGNNQIDTQSLGQCSSCHQDAEQGLFETKKNTTSQEQSVEI